MARIHGGGQRPPSETSKYRTRRQTIRNLEALAVLFLADAEDDSDEEQLAALLILKYVVRKVKSLRHHPTGRYGRRGRYDSEKSGDFFQLLLYSFSDRWFKTWMRMDRKSFWYIHDLIADDPVFESTSRRPQRPPKYQLAAFLCLAGADSAIKTASILSTSEGVIYTYVDRTTRAIRNKRAIFLRWPEDDERDRLAAIAEDSGFPSCIGIADGSYLVLKHKPRVNGFAYWCRKKFYALILQATVDVHARFREYDLGWPGSVQDSRVFKNSDLFQNRFLYFRDHEYILVDKGYPLTNFSIRPFNDYDLTNKPEEAARRKKWNRQLSSLRIFVEHAFGRLKGRFPYLRGIEGHDLRRIYRIVQALMILHNILEELHDDPRNIDGFNGADEDGRIFNYGTGDNDDDDDDEEDRDIYEGFTGEDLDADDLYRQGLFRRKALVEYYFENEED